MLQGEIVGVFYKIQDTDHSHKPYRLSTISSAVSEMCIFSLNEHKAIVAEEQFLLCVCVCVCVGGCIFWEWEAP